MLHYVTEKKESTQTDLGSNHLFSKGRYKLCSEAEHFALQSMGQICIQNVFLSST